MRTTNEILAYVEDQICYTQEIMKDKGHNPPLLAKINKEPTFDSLEQKYWLYQYLKWFIQEEI